MNRQSLFSGLLIGLGAYGFLALGGIPGAVIFAFGLVTIVLSGTPLYTGKAGCTNDIPALVKIWFFNIIGCALIGLMVAYLKGDAAERAVTVVAGRLEVGPLKAFVKAIGCGMIIDTVVWLYREKKGILPVIIGVPLFIVCGFYHSIADVVYLVGAWKWDNAILLYYPAIVLGNYVGCNVRRVVLPKDFLKQ